MKINICQFDYNTLAIQNNKNKIKHALLLSDDDVLNIFAELSLTGSPLYNRNLYSNVYKETSLAGDELCNTKKSFIIGTPAKSDEFYYNSLVFVDKGEVKAISTKRNLSNFDGNYSIGNGMEVVHYNNKKIAFGFYDDFFNFVKRKLKVDTIILVSNILFDRDYDNEIEKHLSDYAKQLNTNVIFVNRIGSEGNIIFQGGSFFINRRGEVVKKLPEFEEQQVNVNTDENNAKSPTHNDTYEERIFKACVLGIRDYWHKSKINKAVIGLSGGIDSAVVVVLAVAALGKENVVGILMPSEFSSEHSINDAIQSAQNLGIKYYTVPIQSIFESTKSTLKELLDTKIKDTTEENLQARSRCMIVMAFANRLDAAMLNTSNKSESAVGYGTLYGDDSGALGPIGDLYKEDVYKLAYWINRNEEIIPWNSIKKFPSAELRPNQKDSDTLPEYGILDKIIKEHIENHLSSEEIIAKGYKQEDVNKVLHLYNTNEWKRRQEAPALRLSKTCFATDFKINY